MTYPLDQHTLSDPLAVLRTSTKSPTFKLDPKSLGDLK